MKFLLNSKQTSVPVADFPIYVSRSKIYFNASYNKWLQEI